MDTINTNFDNWGTYILKQFQYMYERGEQCDFQISCDKKVVLVHRIIMSACSDYIKDLEHSQRITLPDQVSYRILKRVIDFIYSGKIVFKKEEKDELLLTANLLNLKLLEELIKTEESIPYTLQLDDDEAEYNNTQTVGKIDKDPLEDSITDAAEDQKKDLVEKKEIKRRAPKRKSDQNKNSKKNSILPPLHTFPFLQQKFSAARTYGLIPSLSDPVPSRFTMPDQELQSCGYRATFDSITFDSRPLYDDSDNFIAMDEKHHEFLKKIRQTAHGNNAYKRHNTMYANTLYSPFDRCQPAVKKNDMGKTDMISYPAKSSSGGKNDQTTMAPSTAANIVPEISSESSELMSKTAENIDLVAMPKAGATFSRPSPTKKRVRFSEDINNEFMRTTRTDPGEAAITAQALSETMSILPEPIKPCEIVQGDCEMTNDGGDTVELLNLDNSNIYANHHAQMDAIKSSSTSMTELINCDFEDDAEILMEEANARKSERIDEIDEESKALPSKEIPDEPVNDVKGTISAEQEENDSDLIPTNLFPPSKNTAKTPNTVKRLVLKVKGNETPEQISELVGMCKQNSIFKDKSNLRFKFVTVKGGVGSNASTLSVPVVSTSSTTVIKQLTTANTKISTVVTTPSPMERNSVIKNGAESVKKQGTVENVSGPWSCNECKKITFDSYLQYRNHIHDVHNVPESTTFCKYCGFKATKRNYQLFHLLTKHNVQPPANISFPKCGHCDHFFLSDAFLQKHIAHEHSLVKEEQAKYVCACKQSFETNELWNRHKASGECKKPKTFSCGYCPTIFDRYVNLKAHVRICMKEKAKP